MVRPVFQIFFYFYVNYRNYLSQIFHLSYTNIMILIRFIFQSTLGKIIWGGNSSQVTYNLVRSGLNSIMVLDFKYFLV